MKKINKNELVIICGPNGSGKTTFSKAFLKNRAYIYLCADDIAKEIDPDNFDKARLRAGKEFFHRLEKHKKQQDDILIENTLSGLYLRKMIPQFKEQNYLISIVFIFIDNPQICIERIKERVLKGSHYVTDKDVIRRYYRSNLNFWNHYRLLANNWHLSYNSEDQFKTIAVGVQDQYQIKINNIFEKFIKKLEL